MKDLDLDRLLKSAAQAGEGESIEMPFGFDTRVVALWHANANVAARGLSALLRRIALVSTTIIVAAGAGVYHQISQKGELNELSANEFAIADSAIQDEVGQ
jgi:hypothetical protein